MTCLFYFPTDIQINENNKKNYKNLKLIDSIDAINLTYFLECGIIPVFLLLNLNVQRRIKKTIFF